MLHLIGRILLWLRGGSLKLLLLAGVLLLVWGTISPVGTLVWWLSQEARSLGLKQHPRELPLRKTLDSNAPTSDSSCYVIFLPGVGDFSADQLMSGEAIFFNRLAQAHPECVTVRDVFPYSAANESLGGQRLLAPLWRFADQAEGWLGFADILIKIRNLWRFAISADQRYGVIYNQGIAQAIIERMDAVQPISASPSHRLKIILLGTSGGIQVALGAAPYLDQWLEAKITVISIGGVFSGTSGFEVAEHVYHLYGRQDWVDDLGVIVFPSRRPWAVGSPFNQARQQGRYTSKISGPHAHDGPKGYFGEAPVKEGVTYIDLTLQQVNQLPIWCGQATSDACD